MCFFRLVLNDKQNDQIANSDIYRLLEVVELLWNKRKPNPNTKKFRSNWVRKIFEFGKICPRLIIGVPV